jgi:hypothetical protein
MAKRMGWLEATISIIEKAEKMNEYSALTQYLDRTVEALVAAGHEDEAKRTILFVLASIGKGKGSDTWRRNALVHIRKKHVRLLGTGVSIDPDDFEREEL